MLMISRNTIGTARTDRMMRAGIIPAVILSLLLPSKESSCGPLTELFLPVLVPFGMKCDCSVTLTQVTELCVEGSKIPVSLTSPRRVEAW